MKLIKFPGHNVVLAENQPEYLPLPAYRCQYPNQAMNDAAEFGDDVDRELLKEAKERYQRGELVCCWRLTWLERFRLLWSGCIWQSVLTFHSPLQPQLLEVDRPNYIPR